MAHVSDRNRRAAIALLNDDKGSKKHKIPAEHKKFLYQVATKNTFNKKDGFKFHRYIHSTIRIPDRLVRVSPKRKALLAEMESSLGNNPGMRFNTVEERDAHKRALERDRQNATLKAQGQNITAKQRRARQQNIKKAQKAAAKKRR